MPDGRSARAAIALGSNLGDREQILETAISEIGKLGWIVAVSRFVDTAPVGFVNQPRFLNGALLLETERSPVQLLQELLAIEQRMGRDRTNVPAKGPRKIDLDLILYDDVVVESEELTLPHPRMHERAFVLGPLAEIAPGWVHPVLGERVADLWAKLGAIVR
jgi:2-amino-4-hydroxy-6-hydroxymethyldihydropteridine diphosphokinase